MSVIFTILLILDDFCYLFRMLWRVKQFPSNISITIVNGNYYNEHLPSELNKVCIYTWGGGGVVARIPQWA